MRQSNVDRDQWRVLCREWRTRLAGENLKALLAIQITLF
jgi:hypothetical protein